MRTIIFVVSALLLTGCTSQVRLGQDAYDRGQYREARQHWQPAAERGNPVAQVGMGQLAEISALVDPAYLEPAAQWYYLAAQQGHPEAMYLLGRVLEDLGERQAAEGWLGYAAACGEPDAADYVQARNIDVVAVDPLTLPKDCPNSLAKNVGIGGPGGTPTSPRVALGVPPSR